MNATSTESPPELPTELLPSAAPEPSRRRLYLTIPAVTLLVVLVLNGSWMLWSDQPVTVEPPPLPPLAEVLADQVAAIGKGESDTIHVTDRVVRDQDLAPLRNLAGLRTLILDAGRITDVGMKTIASLPDLSHLRLRESPLTDAGLELLRSSETLRVLNVPQSKISAEGLAKLAELPRLRQLRVGGEELEDLSRGVARLTHLRSVHLIDVPVTDEGLKQIASLPHLESLYLDGPAVTEAGWQWLFENHPQIHVHLNQQHHDRDPARHAHNGGELPL